MKIQDIQISKVKPNPKQPRKEFRNVPELANSIKENDLLQPIVVRQMGKKYQLILGERRFRAFRSLKKSTIPAIIWNVKDDVEALEKSVIENVQREDLTSEERENVISELWNSKKYKSHEELAKKLGYAQVRRIDEFLQAEKERQELKAPVAISTKTLLATTGLEPSERKEIFRRVESGSIGASRVREEVAHIKRIKEIQNENKIEIPIEFKKASFILDTSKRISDWSNWILYYKMVKKENWDANFTEAQMRQVKNCFINHYNMLTEFMEQMKWLED